MPVVTASDNSVTVPTTGAGQPLVQLVTKALWVWDTLRLEIGEVALITDDHRDANLMALAATWYGASPVLFITDDEVSVPRGVTPLRPIAGGPETKALAARLSERPGAAAIDLTGRSDTVDVLLEAMPRFSRLLLGGTSREPLTIDYYVNVHRKGLRLVSAALDDPSPSLSAELVARQERAARLLAQPARLQTCLGAARGIGSRTARD
jgi:hypothetical protein